MHEKVGYKAVCIHAFYMGNSQYVNLQGVSIGGYVQVANTSNSQISAEYRGYWLMVPNQ